MKSLDTIKVKMMVLPHQAGDEITTLGLSGLFSKKFIFLNSSTKQIRYYYHSYATLGLLRFMLCFT